MEPKCPRCGFSGGLYVRTVSEAIVTGIERNETMILVHRTDEEVIEEIIFCSQCDAWIDETEIEEE